MTCNIINPDKNKDFDSTVNNSEWTTKPQPLELSHVRNNHTPLKKHELNEC